MVGEILKNTRKHWKTCYKDELIFGITFNLEKCQFGVNAIDFYGHRFTKEGRKPSPAKIRAVQDRKAKESKDAVRSFLGMTSYLSKFILRYSSLRAPLRALTHKDAKFQWEPKEKEAFLKVRKSITIESTMVYLNPTRLIIVRVEASYYERLSPGLFQKIDKGLQPVHFISRTMTEVEKVQPDRKR